MTKFYCSSSLLIVLITLSLLDPLYLHILFYIIRCFFIFAAFAIVAKLQAVTTHSLPFNFYWFCSIPNWILIQKPLPCHLNMIDHTILVPIIKSLIHGLTTITFKAFNKFLYLFLSDSIPKIYFPCSTLSSSSSSFPQSCSKRC